MALDYAGGNVGIDEGGVPQPSVSVIDDRVLDDVGVITRPEEDGLVFTSPQRGNRNKNSKPPVCGRFRYQNPQVRNRNPRNGHENGISRPHPALRGRVASFRRGKSIQFSHDFAYLILSLVAGPENVGISKRKRTAFWIFPLWKAVAELDQLPLVLPPMLREDRVDEVLFGA
jgi:hypothetical protein